MLGPGGTLLARILLVDDDADLREFVGLVLRKQLHDVEEANDPSEAMSVLANDTFDLIILDVEMPGMDGITFATMLRDDDRFRIHRSTPVVICTGLDDLSVMVDALEAGAVFFYHKPFTPESLADTVRAVLAQPY